MYQTSFLSVRTLDVLCNAACDAQGQWHNTDARNMAESAMHILPLQHHNQRATVICTADSHAMHGLKMTFSAVHVV